MTGDWVRVSRREPCEVCEKPDWCTRTADGAVACCMRIESAKPLRNGGWLHHLRDPADRRSRRRTRRVPLQERQETDADFGRLAERYEKAVDPDALARFAADLGVSPNSLFRLRIGWTGRAWAFPHTDAKGQTVGIHLRLSDGGKPYVKGSHPGLVVPRDLGECDCLIVAEGETDLAALLTLGFNAIGRPGCKASMGLLHSWVKRRRVQNVVVVADNDAAGRAGALALATVLAALATKVRVVYPPDTFADIRAWIQGGATALDVRARIAEATPIRLGITTRRAAL